MKLDLGRGQQLIQSCRRSNRDGARKLSGADLVSLLRREVKRCERFLRGKKASLRTLRRFFAFVKFFVSYVREWPTASVGSLNRVPSLWFHSSQIAQA